MISTGGISVVICAHTQKRWYETCAAVESVRAQSLPSHEIIVVVDHNPALEAALAAGAGRRHRGSQPGAQGLSGGKNTGVAMARGDVVAFLDDDAVADRDWLKYFADSYADPAVIGVGGRTLPNWEARRPSWFPAEFAWVVGATTAACRSPAPVRNLLGGNASFRREAFDIAGGFQNGIGRSAAKRPLGCEETEFCIRLGQRSPGPVFLFDDRAVIWHLVRVNATGSVTSDAAVTRRVCPRRRSPRASARPTGLPLSGGTRPYCRSAWPAGWLRRYRATRPALAGPVPSWPASPPRWPVTRLGLSSAGDGGRPTRTEWGRPHDHRPAPPVPILMYHEIAPRRRPAASWLSRPSASPPSSRYLHDAGFQTVTAGTAEFDRRPSPASRLPDRGRSADVRRRLRRLPRPGAAPAGPVRLHRHGVRDHRLGRRTPGRPPAGAARPGC